MPQTCPPTPDTGDGTTTAIAPLAVSTCTCPYCRPQQAARPATVTCAQCRLSANTLETSTTAGGVTVCDLCLSNFYRQCIHCGGWNLDGADCAQGCCNADCDCIDCAEFDTYPVQDYSYKPRPVFHGTGPLFLGPEIEIAAPADRDRECARYAARTLGSLGYLKDDSSIGVGFELVTHPMAYQWALDNFPWQTLTGLAERGCTTTTRTGMHIHLSRAGFTSPCHTYRWMKFIYRNEHQVTAVARRTSEYYAAFVPGDRQRAKQAAKGYRFSDRNRAINTCNQDTIELRIFASSLDPQTVQSALGFAAASVEYTRALTANDIARHDGWQWATFTDWVADRPAYQPLHQQLEALTCAC